MISPLSALGFASRLEGIGQNVAASMVISAYERDPSERSKALRSASITAEAKQISTFTPAEEVLSDPRWVHFILNDPDGHIRSALTAFVPDDRHVLMAVFLKPDLSFNEELDGGGESRGHHGLRALSNTTTVTTGVPENQKDVSDYIRTGLRDLVALATFVMCLILVLAFRVRWRLLPLGVLGVGMIWAFGLVGFLGIPLTFATLTAVPVLMGVGMDYTIRDARRIEEEVCLNRSSHPIQSGHTGTGARPAHRDIRRRVRLRRAVVRPGSGRAPVRVAHDRRHHRGLCCSLILTLAILGIREYRSPTKARDPAPGP